jgi:hypothetical protein
LIEAVIAASIVTAALMNLSKARKNITAALAFVFGLVHGLGFANALSGLGTERTTQLASLLGLNLGVELGQIAVVFVILPVLLVVGFRKSLQPLVLKGTSVTCGAVGTFWFVERLMAV